MGARAEAHDTTAKTGGYGKGQRLEVPDSHAGTRGIAASTRGVKGEADSEIPYPSPYPATK